MAKSKARAPSDTFATSMAAMPKPAPKSKAEAANKEKDETKLEKDEVMMMDDTKKGTDEKPSKQDGATGDKGIKRKKPQGKKTKVKKTPAFTQDTQEEAETQTEEDEEDGDESDRSPGYEDCRASFGLRVSRSGYEEWMTNIQAFQNAARKGGQAQPLPRTATVFPGSQEVMNRCFLRKDTVNPGHILTDKRTWHADEASFSCVRVHQLLDDILKVGFDRSKCSDGVLVELGHAASEQLGYNSDLCRRDAGADLECFCRAFLLLSPGLQPPASDFQALPGKDQDNPQGHGTRCDRC